MRESSVFEGIHVVAKFYLSKDPEGEYSCISRTLGKFSIIHYDYKEMVGNKELWVCRIMGEIKPQKNYGALILKPVEKIEDTSIRKIIPGFYNVQKIGRAALVTPNTDPDKFWMISSNTRQLFSKRYYATIVPIAYKSGCYEPEELEELDRISDHPWSRFDFGKEAKKK
jgi:hypothetical protein